MDIHKGDNVIILSGTDKGKTGRVLSVFPDKQRLIVERINLI
ncbi:MAG TPA: KOW motif domain-containing protein, partial [Spirochaetia bacterium]|nr:KOW motif domain-containing protein [Spirochaetia bacterium]